MKRADDFFASLAFLRQADFEKASEDPFYLSGVLTEFSRTFELAWKSVQEYLRDVLGMAFAVGSPRQVLRVAFAQELLEEEVWLSMLEDRNKLHHHYARTYSSPMLHAVESRYIPAFTALERMLRSQNE